MGREHPEALPQAYPGTGAGYRSAGKNPGTAGLRRPRGRIPSHSPTDWPTPAVPAPQAGWVPQSVPVGTHFQQAKLSAGRTVADYRIASHLFHLTIDLHHTVLAQIREKQFAFFERQCFDDRSPPFCESLYYEYVCPQRFRPSRGQSLPVNRKSPVT